MRAGRSGRQRPLEALRPEPLLAQAIADTGLDDFGDDWFREPLEVLCRSLREEAGLSPLGALAQQQQLVQLLRSRLRVGERVLDMTQQLQERVSELVQALGRVKQLEAMVAGSSRV